jgi:hypothetical protein
MAHQTERGVMGKGGIASFYRGLSREDRRTFDRWLKANAIVGAIFATGLIVMALTGSRSVGSRDAELASRTKASDVAVSEQRWRQPGITTTQDPKVRQKLF